MGCNLSIAQTNTDFQVWTASVFDYQFSNSWLLEVEVDYNSLISGGPEWYEFGVQPTVEFYPNQSFDIFGGFYAGVVRQFPDENSNEIRPILGFRWNIIKPSKRVFLRYQYKQEFRFFRDVEEGTKSNSNRIRSRLDLFIPITKKSYSDDNDLYAKIWFEYFSNLDKNILERFRMQRRVIIGLGYRLSYSWRFELDYIQQGSRNNRNESFSNSISNIVMGTIKFYVPN